MHILQMLGLAILKSNASRGAPLLGGVNRGIATVLLQRRCPFTGDHCTAEIFVFYPFVRNFPVPVERRLFCESCAHGNRRARGARQRSATRTPRYYTTSDNSRAFALRANCVRALTRLRKDRIVFVV